MNPTHEEFVYFSKPEVHGSFFKHRYIMYISKIRVLEQRQNDKIQMSNCQMRTFLF